MLDKHSEYIDHIKIGFDRKFISSLSLLSKRRIEPIIVNKDDEMIITGIKCPVTMNEETFDDDKKAIESDILRAFALILNSEICNRKREDDIRNRVKKKSILKRVMVPCPKCGSVDTIANGKRVTNIGPKQIRYCKKCDECYTVQENAMWKKKKSRQVVEEAIELSKEFSLRESALKIKEKYDVTISHSSICIWRKKSKIVEKSRYAKS